MNLDKINHIAILRLSALGDVCHAMLVVTAIKKRYPNAKITWITSPLEAHIVRHIPDVNVCVYDKKTGIKGMLAIRQKLASISFDVLLHMQWSLRASILSRMVKANTRVGFALSHSREKQHWFVNELAPEPRGPHVLDALFSLAEAIDVKELPLKSDITLESLAVNLPPKYVVINPSASKQERNWTLAGYQSLIHFFAERAIPVVLTGSPAQQEVNFANTLLDDPAIEKTAVINLVGKTSIAQMMSVIHSSALVISPDTGPAHIATLVGTPVVGLYAHSNPKRTGPYKDLDKVVSVYDELAEQEYGKPSSELAWAARVHDPDAMSDIDLEQVLEKIKPILNTIP